MTTAFSFQVSSDIKKSHPIETDLTTELLARTSSNPGNPHNQTGNCGSDSTIHGKTEDGNTSTNQHEKTETIQLTKRLQVTDSNQKVIYDSKDTPCKSFVIAFIRALWACFIRANIASPDILGISRPLVTWGSRNSIMMFINAGPAETTFGPVIGSGSAPLNDLDHRLDTQISHGTGHGQLSYGPTVLMEPTPLRGTLTITIIRAFTNRSPAEITVAECGIYGRGHITPDPTHHCLIRDLISPTITVPQDHAILLEYKILTRV